MQTMQRSATRLPRHGSFQPAALQPRVVRAAAQSSPHCEPVPALTAQDSSRRSLLFLAAAAMAFQPNVVTATAYDGKLVCASDTETEEEDTKCRMDALVRDAGKKENYGDVTVRKFELAPNVPVAVLDSEYYQATLKISDEIEQYCTMDVYDKQRIPLIKSLKQDGLTWVSKYARGGSARTQSARRMYIAVDSVVGHLASNGLAPLPRPKVQTVLKTVAEAKDLLAKNL